MTKVNCKKCGKEFFTYEAWLRRGRGKFCSKYCSHKETWKFPESPGYGALHQWIAKERGKASRCDGAEVGIECSAKSQVFDWALRRGKEYSWDMGNYIQLCRSCHRKYDYIKPQPTVRERFLQARPREALYRINQPRTYV